MKIKYNFANEAIEIEVDEQWGDVLIDLDRREYNNNHSETRHHTTLHSRPDEGEWFSVEDADLAALFADETDEQRINRAIAQLKPKQQELVAALFFDGLTQAEYAMRKGISQQAVSQQLETVLKKLKQFF